MNTSEILKLLEEKLQAAIDRIVNLEIEIQKLKVQLEIK